MRSLLAVVALVLALPAHADALARDLEIEVGGLFGPPDKPPAFGFINDAFYLGRGSYRRPVALYGSSAAERVVGGAKVKATLGRWGFSFKPRDGIHAGIVDDKVAWVAANVDATKGGKSSPYRVLAIYEQVGGAWQLVQAQFSVVVAR